MPPPSLDAWSLIRWPSGAVAARKHTSCLIGGRGSFGLGPSAPEQQVVHGGTEYLLQYKGCRTGRLPSNGSGKFDDRHRPAGAGQQLADPGAEVLAECVGGRAAEDDHLGIEQLYRRDQGVDQVL